MTTDVSSTEMKMGNLPAQLRIFQQEMTAQVDEETPLLEGNGKQRPTPLPAFQFSIVLFLQLAEPLTSHVIYPFAPQFPNIYVLILCESNPKLIRDLGITNGRESQVGYYVGLMAYAYMPIAWSTGGTLGPIIGGSLARPADRFPTLFGNNEFLKKYPYFLPCAVPATFSALAWVVTYLYLKETVSAPTPISEFLGIKKGKALDMEEADSAPSGSKNSSSVNDAEKPLPLRKLLTGRVIVAAGNYAALSLVDISFRAIQPLFLSTPIELGGLGLPPSTIGNLLSIFGILNGVFQVFFFAKINDTWGSKNVFICGIASAVPVFASFPVINYLARAQGYSTLVWAVVGFQIVISIALSLSYGAIFIFISTASPNRASLGATNGLSQMTVSIMRAIGPAAANSLFSLSIDKNYLGGNMVYYILLSIVAISLYIASLLPQKVWTN
ncbi:Major facilitator-type transporter psiT2 [Psilocybe cubensis]|uniref:Major facilitator-type transporter psiT2 n=1 Tax=Psilocybe cubensis TaxID=181762 RepID=A0ACB8H2A6_PSICU|nr:Major facilitator-type transporter psiT2 [Psilocybe cubensis]KAH9481767.1 Major facilitator-type transporter psiT2 [Psilocybe cubensis]